MRNLHELAKPSDVEELAILVSSFSIYEKIEFSGISKESILAKIADLRERQVPKREVLLSVPDEEVVFYWFKNWLHPSLKHWCKPAPRDKRGCSRERILKDQEQDNIRFLENGQQNYDYTLEDIINYANS